MNSLRWKSRYFFAYPVGGKCGAHVPPRALDALSVRASDGIHKVCGVVYSEVMITLRKISNSIVAGPLVGHYDRSFSDVINNDVIEDVLRPFNDRDDKHPAEFPICAPTLDASDDPYLLAGMAAVVLSAAHNQALVHLNNNAGTTNQSLVTCYVVVAHEPALHVPQPHSTRLQANGLCGAINMGSEPPALHYLVEVGK